MKHQIKLLILIFFSFAIAPLAAQAGDEPPAVKALLDAMAKQYKASGGNRPTYDSIDESSNGDVTLNGLKWQMKQPEVTTRFSVGKVAISGVSKRGSGAYSFEKIASENITISMGLPDVGPVVVSIPNATTENTHLLPSAGDPNNDTIPFVGTVVYSSGKVPLMTLSVAGQTFNAKNFNTAWVGDPETGFGKWTLDLESIVIPVNVIPEPQARKVIKEKFGIEKFDLALDGSTATTGKDNKIDIAYAFRFKAKQVGELEFAFAGHEIPVALGKILQDLGKGKEPDARTIMPLVVGIKLSRMKMRFVDDNFAAKALAFAAEQQGTSVEAMTSNGAALIQIGLMQLKVPEFTKSVVEAYNAFVKDPKNISIEASPEKPIAFATLMGMMAAPAAAIKTLGVKVEANK